jgi:hypothetical protein
MKLDHPVISSWTKALGPEVAPPRRQGQFSQPWATMLQPSNKKETTHVNKCNGTKINTMKDIHRKNSIHFLKRMMPQMG